MSRYIGLFLDAKSRKALLTMVPPRHATVYGEHVTLFFDPDDEVTAAFRARYGEDETVSVVVDTEFWDDRGQAVRVHFLPVLPAAMTNRRLHITISTAKHTEPAYSSGLLDGACEKRAVGVSTITVSGKIRVCETTKTISPLK